MIRLIILDVDGCLSDGKVIYTQAGVEVKNFNVRDGFGIKMLAKMGYKIAIITGRNSPIVAHRAKELDIEYVYQGVKDKLAVAQTLCEELSILPHEVAAIGDDLNDYRLLQWVGRGFTPLDGSHHIKSVAQVLTLSGGEGCVREMIEILLDENNDYDRFLSFWI